MWHFSDLARGGFPQLQGTLPGSKARRSVMKCYKFEYIIESPGTRIGRTVCHHPATSITLGKPKSTLLSTAAADGKPQNASPLRCVLVSCADSCGSGASGELRTVGVRKLQQSIIAEAGNEMECVATSSSGFSLPLSHRIGRLRKVVIRLKFVGW